MFQRIESRKFLAAAGLVFAVALACWWAQKMYRNEPAGEEAYWRYPHWRLL